MILSTATTSGVEEVTAARGAPVWYQLYATNKWDVAKGMVTRAEKAGCPVVAVTVDRSGGRNQETLFRLQRTDSRDCSGCHDRSSFEANMKRRSMYQGLDLSGLTHTQSSAMTWDFLKRLRDTTKMKIVLKGILAHDDAAPLVELLADEDGELRRGAAERLGAVGRKALLHLWGAQRGHRLGMQPLDDAAGYAGGREQPVPLHRLVAWHPGFGDGRHAR